MGDRDLEAAANLEEYASGINYMIIKPRVHGDIARELKEIEEKLLDLARRILDGENVE